MKQHALRIPDDLLAAIDKRAKKVGLSRNAWISGALEWIIEQPIQTTTIKGKI